MDCPNAQEMFSRFGYRIIRAKWSGKGDNGYTVTLRVIGRDDIAIVTNITSVIGKESNVTLRSLNINSVDGLFQGNFTVLVRADEKDQGGKRRESGRAIKFLDSVLCTKYRSTLHEVLQYPLGSTAVLRTGDWANCTAGPCDYTRITESASAPSSPHVV